MSEVRIKYSEDHVVIIQPWQEHNNYTIEVRQHQTGGKSYSTPLITISRQLAELLEHDGLEYSDVGVYIEALHIANKQALLMYKFTDVQISEV